MSESQSVGGIHYDVAMDVKPLLSGEKQVYTSLDRMEGSFNKASKSIESAEKSMFSFSKAAVAVTSALSVGAIVHAVDEWGQMAARIKMALKSAEGDIEKYGAIQERFLEISNRNGKAIETVQSLYAGSASSMKELGYNTDQTVDYIESLSSAFTSNATGAQQTESAMNALNRAMVVGTLRGNDWHSVLNATPSVVGDIAKELSRLRGGVTVTENEVKKMAMETGISMQLFSDAMIHAREENNALADSMDNTVADGFTKLTNSAKAYFGELNQSLGITRSVSAGFAVLSNNFDSVAVAAMALAAVMTGRLAGAMAVSIQSKLGSVVSARKLVIADAQAAKAEEQLALASLRSSNAAKQRALDEVKLAQMMKASAIGADQVTAAEARLSAARQNASVAVSNYNQALTTHTAAQSASAAAAARASITIGGALRGALGLVGGPVGFAVLAASGLFYFSQKAEEARNNANGLADGVNNLISRFKEMTKVQIGEEIAKANKQIPELQDGVKEAQKKFDDLTSKISAYNKEIYNFGEKTRRGREASEALKKTLNDQAIAAGELEKAKQRLSQTESFVTIGTAKFNGELLTGIELLTKEAKSVLPNGSAALRQYGVDLDNATKSKQKFNAQSLMLDFGGEKGEALKKKIERDLALSKVEGEAKVRLQVKFAADDAGVLDPKAIENLQDKAVEEYKNNEGKKESIKTSKDAASAAAKEATEAEKLQKKITDLANATKVAELETKGLSREAAILEAVQSLGSKASEKQIKEITELASKEFDLKQAIKDREDSYKQNIGLQATRDQKLALEQLDRQLKANLVTEEQYQKRRAEINAEYSRKIAEENAKSVITPTQEMAGQLDPVQRLANENAQKLALIQEYVNQKVLTEEQGLALMNAANREYEQSRFDAMWGLWKGQNDLNNLMGTAIDSLSSGTATAVSAMLSGTQSAGDAMRNLANTALNAMIQQLMQMAVQALITRTILGTFMGGLGAIPNIASVASSVTSLSNIGGMGMPTDFRSYGGGRYNGGSVNPNNYYRFGERGKPEILQTSSGKNYLLPGEGGKVIPNKGLQGGGSSMPPIINVYQQASGAAVDVSAEKGLNQQDVINIVVYNIAQGGSVRDAITTYTSANSKAHGGY
ncbi:tape measure protein [Providencia sp. Me31A]|uniref:tape measure protein n=1 Tax=Providencia sp. Me31A TaxID=3392637 RepID=UPI003D2A6995